MPENGQCQTDAKPDAGADCTDLHFRLNRARVSEDNASDAVPEHRKAHLGAPGQREIPADRQVARCIFAARADSAELEAAHRADTARIEALEERRRSPDPARI